MQTLYRTDERFPPNTMSRLNIVRKKPVATVVSILGDRQHFCCFREEYVLRVIGDKIFWKKLNTVSLTFKNGRFYGNIEVFSTILCKVFKLDWIDNNCINFLNGNKTLWKLVIQGKITNPEDLYKKYSKLYFKGAFSYKNLKKFSSIGIPCSLWDLYYYCDNPDEGLRQLLLMRETGEFDYVFSHVTEYNNSQEHDSPPIREYEITDYISYCVILGDSKWNPKWSKRRLREEHQKQIRRVHLLDLEEKSTKQIAPPFSNNGLSLILDERTCYSEGMDMCNCIHACYWPKVKAGNYMIAKGTVNGIHLNLGINNNLELDQVHTIRNGNVSKDVQTKCLEWIESNKEHLLMILNQIKENELCSQGL